MPEEDQNYLINEKNKGHPPRQERQKHLQKIDLILTEIHSGFMQPHDEQHSLEQALPGQAICKLPAQSLAFSRSSRSCTSLCFPTASYQCSLSLICLMSEAFKRTQGSSQPFKPVAKNKAQKRDSTELNNKVANVYFLSGNLAWLGCMCGG